MIDTPRSRSRGAIVTIRLARNTATQTVSDGVVLALTLDSRLWYTAFSRALGVFRFGLRRLSHWLCLPGRCTRGVRVCVHRTAFLFLAANGEAPARGTKRGNLYTAGENGLLQYTPRLRDNRLHIPHPRQNNRGSRPFVLCYP